MIGVYVTIDETLLKVFKNGTIERKMTNNWKEIKINIPNLISSNNKYVN